MPKSTAPDVDLRSRGFDLRQLLVGSLIFGAVALFIARWQVRDGEEQPIAEDEEGNEEGISLWALWFVLWALRRFLQLVAGMAFMLLAVLVVRQRSILYVPVPPGTERSTKDNPSMYRSPKNWGLPFENLMIKTEDGTLLNAWLVYHPLEKCKKVPYTLVYFHGNAGNIGHRLENIKDMWEKLFLNILIVDYRGYGDSEDGTGPSEHGFMMDARATYRWLVDRIRDQSEPQVTSWSLDRILFFGRSIGGCVATCLAARVLKERLMEEESGDPNLLDEKPLPLPAGIVLENTFTSLREMAVTVFPFLGFLKPLLRSPIVFDEWRASESLEFFATHHEHWCCCLLSGAQDKIVPPIQMRQLHAILKEHRPKVLKLFVFANGGHNDTPHQGGAEYWASCQKFMELLEQSEEERLEALRLRGLGSS